MTTDNNWRAEALCAQTDPEAFFPDKGGSTGDAKRICLMCDVMQQCREVALADPTLRGVWGGLSEKERRKIHRENRSA